MDEIIVRVLRTIACRTRLRILSLLATGEESTPSQIARALRLDPDLVSAHLTRLDSAGLVCRRRSGVHCYCAARSPYGERALSGQLAEWLYAAFKGAPPSAAGASSLPRAHHGTADGARRAAGEAFDAATAFTHLRRLQILRRLAGGAAVDLLVLSRELRMSPAAVSRHVAKLARRGYATTSPQGRRCACQAVVRAKTALHARLLEIVAGHWGAKGPLHT